MTLEPNHQNSSAMPPALTPERKRRKNNFLWIVGGSLAFHAALYFLALQVPPPLLPVPDRLIEIDLRHYKPLVEPKPTVEKPVTPPKPHAQPVIKAAALKQTPPQHQKADVPEPTVAPDPTTEPEPTAEPIPTVEPEPTSVPEPTAAPEPTAVPAKVLPHKEVVTPPKLPAVIPTRRDKPTRVAEAPDRHVIPVPADSAPKSQGQPKPADQAGTPNGSQTRALPGKSVLHPLRDAPNFGGNSAAQGGTNNNAQTLLPKGQREGRPNSGNRAADNQDMGAHRANGLPGFGTRNGGSKAGHNPELAGTDGAGMTHLAKLPPRRGGGGGPDRVADLFSNTPTDFAAATKTARGPGANGGAGGRAGGGTGRDSGDGDGFSYRGGAHGAFAMRPGGGVGGGAGSHIGGPPGGGNGGETAGNGGSGGYNGGRGTGTSGNGNGGGRHMRFAGGTRGDPFGSSIGGNPNGGGGRGGGPGGPGSGTRIARHFGDRDGDGNGNGDGSRNGPGGGGDEPGFHHGGGNPGAGGLHGTGSRAGNDSGSGNGGGAHGHGGEGGTGDTAGGAGDTAGSGYTRGHHRGGGPIRIASREGDDAILGRGLMRSNGESGIDAYYYEDADLADRKLDTKVYELEQKGQAINIPIDWPTETHLKRKKVDQIIDFDWHGDAPVPGVRGSFFSVKWVGKIFVPKEDDYRFQFENLDDGGELVLDGKSIIKIWKVQKSSPSTDQSYHLTRGPHSIEIHYVQGPPTAASITLKWMSSSFPWETVGAYHADQ